MEIKNIYKMKQPELGKRILELRKEKGFTQEELVAQCNINVRTIQRIEAGEVNPRSYTVKIILEVLGEDLKEIQKEASTEKSNILWTDKDLKTLKNSWFFGVFYAIITLVWFIFEIYFEVNNLNQFWVLAFRVPLSIVFILTLCPFLKGYRLIAKKFTNTLLLNAVYIYLVITVIMTISNLFVKGSGLVNAIEIIIGIFSMIIFGIGELIIGLGILKLKRELNSLSQIVGIAKIVNGGLLISVILSPIALFFVVPILVLEIVFLNNIFKTAQKSQIDDTLLTAN
jgi:transcriptional regulator with XRE-family HTH domain